MTGRAAHRIRALLALALFGMSAGGAQLLDALVFHSGTVPVQIEGARVNAGDHCHAESCDLGAPIASPPPITSSGSSGRIEPPTRLVLTVVPLDAPRSAVAVGPLGSRAPPLHS